MPSSGSSLHHYDQIIRGVESHLGKRAYLVGGAVRDAILGRPSKDVDLTTIATPEHMDSLGFKQVKGDFPVYTHKKFPEVEVALARGEKKTGTGYQGFSWHLTDNLHDDLMRRDLRINAMAYHPDEGVVDPYHGQDDIKSKTLRHIGAHFAEDPLRTFRAARFAAQKGFQIHPSTIEMMKSTVPEHPTLDKHRIHGELQKVLASQQPRAFFDSLHKAGSLGHWFPEIAALKGRESSLAHTGDAYDHTMDALTHASKVGASEGAKHLLMTQQMSPGEIQAYGKRLPFANAVVQGMQGHSAHHRTPFEGRPDADTTISYWLGTGRIRADHGQATGVNQAVSGGNREGVDYTNSAFKALDSVKFNPQEIKAAQTGVSKQDRGEAVKAFKKERYRQALPESREIDWDDMRGLRRGWITPKGEYHNLEGSTHADYLNDYRDHLTSLGVPDAHKGYWDAGDEDAPEGDEQADTGHVYRAGYIRKSTSTEYTGWSRSDLPRVVAHVEKEHPHIIRRGGKVGLWAKKEGLEGMYTIDFGKQMVTRDRGGEVIRTKGVFESRADQSIQAVLSEREVYRVDDAPNVRFEPKTYWHNKDWTHSGAGREGPAGTRTSRATFATPSKSGAALYTAPRDVERAMVHRPGGASTIMFNQSDRERVSGHRPTLSTFSRKNFRALPRSGEVVAGKPVQPRSRERITDPVGFMKSQGHRVAFVKDVRKTTAALRARGRQVDTENLPESLEDARSYYSSEGCPHHAIALHRRTGWPIYMMRERNHQGEIAHVYVRHPDGDAMDVHGKRPISALNDHWHDVQEPHHHEVGTERDLRRYMGDSDRKPLYAFSEDEVREADRHIQTHQPNLGETRADQLIQAVLNEASKMPEWSRTSAAWISDKGDYHHVGGWHEHWAKNDEKSPVRGSFSSTEALMGKGWVRKHNEKMWSGQPEQEAHAHKFWRENCDPKPGDSIMYGHINLQRGSILHADGSREDWVNPSY